MSKNLDALLEHRKVILKLHELFDLEGFEPIAKWLKEQGEVNASTRSTTKEK